MTGTACYVQGFTNAGEPYTPMEFTSRSAWLSYYGAPDNEAERYAYAAVVECLNQGGRLYFARLPYDNAAFEKVACCKYKVGSCDGISSVAYVSAEISEADPTISNVVEIVPKGAAYYDLSAIDEYRTDENKVAAGTFMIADIAFNTYDRVPEDSRKNEKREMVGILPVVTTAANAMYAQSLIKVENKNVTNFETVGSISSMDATQLSGLNPKLSTHRANALLSSDATIAANSYSWFSNISCVDIVSSYVSAVSFDSESAAELCASAVLGAFSSKISSDPASAVSGWLSGTCGDKVQWELSADKVVSASVPAKIRIQQSSLIGDLSSLQDRVNMDMFGWHGKDGDDNVPDTISRDANGFFPTIAFDGDKFDRENLKKIGVVVYRMFVDPAEGNKVGFEPVEAYAGSLCKDDKDPNTGVTTFIDTIINSQSKYINFFSNCFSKPADKKDYNEKVDILVMKPGKARKDETVSVRAFAAAQDAIDRVGAKHDFAAELATDADAVAAIDELLANPDVSKTDRSALAGVKKAFGSAVREGDETAAYSLGFYWEMTKEDISVSKSIYDGMNKSFEKVSDVIERDIDIVPDAGLANIASYLKAIYGDKGQYDLNVTDDMGNSLLGMWRCDKNDAAVKTWKTVEQKLDNFCKNIRKDCMFIADGPRPLVLAGQKKIVRPTKPTNTIDACIIPNIKWVTGLNTSYGAMYVDWFEQADDYTGDFFWCPPSIKAMGVYINTDVNFNYWDAPAGLNRGVIAATDVAFSPTIKQAGAFYEKNLNYAINYPADGIVLEGQKTLQTKPTALDRVNVRRLCLRLERAAAKQARWFLYEGNTAYTRQRIIDSIDPYFKEAKVGGGLYDYKIICDESNNTPDTIDRNELHLSIGVKPVKTIEFIMIDFVIAATGMTWEEAGL